MRALDWLLDLLYPPKCVICRRLLARGEQDICPTALRVYRTSRARNHRWAARMASV